ncbi:MAG: hypothetical protein ACT6XY_11520 [Phreatobacter sp.]|jgi:hypothetical protein|uniref:hypothetical protein n=1 Tax=Phreatobacter sp. TaxID=1966341 RepID=UPI00403537F9
MIRRLVVASLAALAVSAATTDAFAQAQQNFRLINRTGYQINEVYVSPSAVNSWGGDVLGDGVMPPGTSRNIRFPRRTQACIFDLRVVYADGERGEVSRLDLCQISNVTITWNGRSRFTVD